MTKRNAATPQGPGHAEAQDRAHLRRQVRALRTGVTFTALLGGVACYIFLTQFGVPSLLAGIIGLVFALLGRVAIASLAVDFVLRSATRDADRIPPHESPAPTDQQGDQSPRR